MNLENTLSINEIAVHYNTGSKINWKSAIPSSNSMIDMNSPINLDQLKKRSIQIFDFYDKNIKKLVGNLKKPAESQSEAKELYNSITKNLNLKEHSPAVKSNGYSEDSFLKNRIKMIQDQSTLTKEVLENIIVSPLKVIFDAIGRIKCLSEIEDYKKYFDSLNFDLESFEKTYKQGKKIAEVGLGIYFEKLPKLFEESFDNEQHAIYNWSPFLMNSCKNLIYNKYENCEQNTIVEYITGGYYSKIFPSINKKIQIWKKLEKKRRVN